MTFEIAIPLSRCAQATGGSGGGYVYPPANEASDLSRLFLLCDIMGEDRACEVACRAVYHAVCDSVMANYDSARAFEPRFFDEALHAAVDSLDSVAGEQLSADDVSLSCVVLHRGGIFCATTGNAQAMIVKTAQAVTFRSQGAMQLDMGDVEAGDYIYMSNDRAGIMADDEIVGVLADDGLTDAQKLERLHHATVGGGDRRMEQLIHITDVNEDDTEAAESQQPAPTQVPRQGRLHLVPKVIVATVAISAIGLLAMFLFALASYFFDRLSL